MHNNGGSHKDGKHHKKAFTSYSRHSRSRFYLVTAGVIPANMALQKRQLNPGNWTQPWDVTRTCVAISEGKKKKKKVS